MKTKKIVAEIICMVILLNFFYEGIYKVAYFQQFGFYITHAPLLRSSGNVLKYVIPFGEIALALSFFIPYFRVKALYITVTVLIIYILWIMIVFFSAHYLFWPYHTLWGKPIWMQKMLVSLGLCWLAFTAILLLNPKLSLKEYFSKSLRNTPAMRASR